ncbi:protein of unknown function [Candidatus Promineifilum breve]|uniref:Uncharacterized protein n=1 Tax=Candidatus Promineifilum breve TaxID=1806508 RepID=A0A160T0T2_9CHLR|nr:protein of unknown function [Candidatus Promineifilum breve]
MRLPVVCGCNRVYYSSELPLRAPPIAGKTDSNSMNYAADMKKE